MRRVETRTQLINFICENISQNAIVRACHQANGNVQVMGGFSKIRPLSVPGWVVAITSIHGRTWLVAVTPDDHRHIFRVCLIESIPWKYYIGRIDREEYSIYDGDNPQQACLARDNVK